MHSTKKDFFNAGMLYAFLPQKKPKWNKRLQEDETCPYLIVKGRMGEELRGVINCKDPALPELPPTRRAALHAGKPFPERGSVSHSFASRHLIHAGAK